jgi:TonB family protein
MRASALLLLLAGCGATPKQEVAAPVAAAPEPERKRDPDSEIQLQGELGQLEQEQIEGAFRPVNGQINACYQGGVEKLWYLGGTLELKVRVLKEGGVENVSTVTPLGNYDVERCVLGIVQRVSFPKPKGGAPAEFNYTWNFRAKAAIQEWGNDDVGDHFSKRRKELAVCEKKGPVPPGLRVTFFVTPGGKVTSVGLGADAPLDEAYAQCVAGRVVTWKFNDPLGKIARATYQFQ